MVCVCVSQTHQAISNQQQWRTGEENRALKTTKTQQSVGAESDHLGTSVQRGREEDERCGRVPREVETFLAPFGVAVPLIFS
ncbi:hypothetical protein ZHAS_00019026 [Anopheles sinensis]|uniref:Uncharacterized protein n=1 Tax=Anopheles sinensis TaxID=74873 RepID=A0A084WL88_ANOSI|nr:hypothetical protein ZHAS_00019026 [Anopheles sinensis]